VQLDLHAAKAAADANAASELKIELSTAQHEVASGRDELKAAKARINKLDAEIDRLKHQLEDQSRSSASSGAAQHELHDQLKKMADQNSRDAEELASLRKEVDSQKKYILELRDQIKESGSTDAQRIHEMENALADTKYRMSEAAKDFKFRELRTSEEIEQLKKTIQQLEDEKASNGLLLEAGLILGKEAKILQPKAAGCNALFEQQHTAINILSNPKSAGSLPNKIKAIKHRNDDIQASLGSLTHVIELCKPFMPKGEIFELSMAFIETLFDELDEDETEMVPRLDLRERIDTFVAQDPSIQNLSDSIRALDAMIVERDEYLEICEAWLARHK